MPITINAPSTHPWSTATIQQQPSDKRAGDTPSLSFADFLGEQVRHTPASGETQAEPPATIAAPPADGPQVRPGLVPLGTITSKTPSISHLLHKHPTLRQEGWDIIHAEANQGKAFTALRPGTSVALNPANRELVWNETPRRPAPAARQCQPRADAQTSGEVLALGAIDQENPTISHLLKKNPLYRDQAWNIIFSAANRNKPYGALQPGSLVSIDPSTLELSFQGSKTPSSSLATAVGDATLPPSPVSGASDEAQRGFAGRFIDSIKSYLGQPYTAIDCYGLVVRGLQDQGVQYGGTGGLRQHLERLAAKQGLPPNAFHNGEGLIEIAGNKLFDESFARITDADRLAKKVMEKLEPLLQEGMLLSFSTPSRGHTGVIGKKNGQWTYVNSGMIDHQVDGGRVSRRVGEETLAEEIRNWFSLAKNKATSLKVSAGVFDTEKLKAKSNMVASRRTGGLRVI